MSQFSRQVTEQMNNAEELRQAIDTHQKRIFSGIVKNLSPYLSEEELKTFAQQLTKVFGAQLTHLDSLTEQMGQIDLDHSRDLLQTQEARTQRDLIIQETFQSVAALKQAISGSHGERAVAILGMAGQTPRRPLYLERWLSNVLNIAAKGVNLPAPAFQNMPAWDASKIESFVKPVLTKLQSAMNYVGKELQEDKDTMTDKWRLMEEQNYAYTAIASIAESYARFCGDHDLGDRLRPRSTNRPGRPRQDEEGEPITDTEGNSPETPMAPADPVVTTNPAGPAE